MGYEERKDPGLSRSSLSKKILVAHLVAAILLCMALTACGGGSVSGLAAPTTSTTNIGDMSQGDVLDVDFNNAKSTEITFDNLNGSESFAFSFFMAGDNTGSQSAVVSALNDPNLPGFVETPGLAQNLEEANSATHSAGFHGFLREQESLVAFDESNEGLSESSGEFSGASSCSGTSFNVLNSATNTNSCVTICADLRHSSEKFNYFVDQSAGSIPAAADLSSYDSNYLSVQSSKLYSIVGGVSDVDANDKVNIVFTAQGIFSQSSGTTGYFFGCDISGCNSCSNHQEVVFVRSPDATWPASFFLSNLLTTVPVHELCHAITYNLKSLNYGVTISSALNEGISHLCEDSSRDADSADLIATTVSVENPSRVGIYLAATSSTPFTGGTSLAYRGGYYLFLRYLCEQSGDCNDFVHDLENSNYTGTNAVTHATGRSFKAMLSDFFTALRLSNTDINANPTYHFTGIDLHSAQYYGGRYTTLSGPTLSACTSSSSVSSPGVIYPNCSGSQIDGGNLNFQTGAVADPGLTITRVN